MRKVLICMAITLFAAAVSGCKKNAAEGDFQWTVEVFDDVRVLRYQVPGFDELSLDDKLFTYYMAEAALCGRDIIFDQNCRLNLPVRRTLEAIYTGYEGDKTTEQWLAFEKYLKKVWFANGIHHHYSMDKFVPEFTEEYYDGLLAAVPAAVSEQADEVRRAIFDPSFMAVRVNQTEGQDLLATSAMNYYEGVTQAEAEAFYAAMGDPNDPTPPSYGLNSKLVKENGELVEKVWKVGGMYSPAIENIVGWLEKAAAVANPTQKKTVEHLIAYYRSGDLRDFDRYNILWVADTVSNTDFVNGFTENYGDPIGIKSSWESVVNFKNVEATKRTEIISDNAQWFEDHSPIADAFKKEEVKGVTAKVITAAMLGGDCYPATPIGINLPNADWIRAQHGSKSVTIENITYAYSEGAKGNGFAEEFVLRESDRELMKKWGSIADNLHTDMHECLGHGSGKLAPGVRGDELRNYGSVLEETRADLFALYFMGDPKMVELGLMETLDVAWAEYYKFMLNGLMTQLMRVQLGKNIEESHMRDRALIANWCYEHGKADKVVERMTDNGKTYFVINDNEKLRALFGQLLTEVQRIKSEGDYEACRELVETYAIKVDHALHAEVLERNERLGIPPYSGFVNPVYALVLNDAGEPTDVTLTYTEGFAEQMLRYSKDYSFLPSKN